MLYSLRSRLIVSFVVLFVLAFGVMSVLLFNQARTTIRSYIESSALEKMGEYGSYIELVQMQIYDVASLVFNNDLTEEWDRALSDKRVSDGEKMLANIQMGHFLFQATQGYTSVDSVAIYRQDGLLVSSENRVESQPAYRLEEWFKRFKQDGQRWVSSHKDPLETELNNDKPVVSLLIPIGAFEPELSRNVMKINVSESYFLEPLSRIHLGQSGTIFLLDRQGEPILSQDNFAHTDQLQAEIQRIRGGYSKQGVVYLQNDSATKDILVYKKLDRTDWMLVGLVSEGDLYADLSKLRQSILFIGGLLLLLSIVIAIWLSHDISRPLSRLVMAMRHVENGEFQYAEARIPPEGTVRNEVGFVTETFRNMVLQLRTYIQQSFELKLLRQQAEYKALLMQIQPHFLFNTLELMSSLSMQKRTEDTVEVIEALGKMLRFSLRMSDDIVLLSEEIRYVQDYNTILQVRFGDKLNLRMRQNGVLDSLTITKFTLQPLIENAVKYSFQLHGEAVVDIEISRTEERVVLRVEDNGPGFDLARRHALLDSLSSTQLGDILSSRSSEIGLGNVLARCRLYYGDLLEVRIEKSRLGGALIELSIPISHQGGNRDA